MPVLAIETSTSSTKAILYDRDKGVLASSRESYGILHQNVRRIRRLYSRWL